MCHDTRFVKTRRAVSAQVKRTEVLSVGKHSLTLLVESGHGLRGPGCHTQVLGAAVRPPKGEQAMSTRKRPPKLACQLLGCSCGDTHPYSSLQWPSPYHSLLLFLKQSMARLKTGSSKHSNRIC